MHIITLRMDRVYGAYPDPFSGNLPRTLFNFDSNGSRYLTISVEGWPRLESGQTITAALRRADDWQTLEGLLIHETGEICSRSPSLYIGLMLLIGFFAVICWMELKFRYPALLVPALIGFALSATACAYGAYRCTKLRRMLRRSAASAVGRVSAA